MRVQVHASGFIGKVIAPVIIVVVLVLIFMISLLVLVPLLLIGSLVLGYQFRKMMRLRNQMNDLPAEMRVIEGEVIHEAPETKLITVNRQKIDS